MRDMDKKRMITSILMIIILATGIFTLYHKNKESTKSDAKRFSEEYQKVTEDNPFVYRTLEEINKILENGTGIIYLGFPECKWCQQYVVYLNEVANDYEIEKIYYANISEDRKENSKVYQKTIELIEEYLQYDEEGNKRIYVPSIIAVYKGDIVGFDDETAWDTNGFNDPQEYWSKEKIDALKTKLEEMFILTDQNISTDCNK